MGIFGKSIGKMRRHKLTTLSIFAAIMAVYFLRNKESSRALELPLDDPIFTSTESKWPDWQLGGNKEKWQNNVQDIICSGLMWNMCFLIVDYEIDGIFQRSIMVNTLVDAKISIADLVKPEVKPFTLSNSAHWKINHYRLHKPYLKAMSTAPFITGTIGKESRGSTILLIGVAGATLNNFYHEMSQEPIITGVELDPAMVDVAEKWFGLKKSSRHKILVEDGVKFFKERSEQDGKFDSIFIDACQTDHDDELHCPIYEFRIEEMAHHVSRSLAENGTLAINVLSLNNTVSAYNKILNVYQRYFSKCFFLDAQNGDWMNRVLVASNNPELEIDQEKFVKRLEENMDKNFLASNEFKVEIVM